MVFEADAEFAVDADHRLDRKAHAGREGRLVAAHHVGLLVRVDADAVARPVWQSGHRVARPVATGLDHAARGGIDGLARCPELRGRESGGLRLLLQVPDFTLPVGRVAENVGPRQVRAVAVEVGNYI